MPRYPWLTKRTLPTSLPWLNEDEIMEPVLDLITSYESRIATVEELMTTAYQATVTSDGNFDILDEERETENRFTENADQELLFTKKGL